MANQGELQFTLPKIDDLTAYELVESVRQEFEVSEPINIKLAHGIRVESAVYRQDNISPSEFKIQEIHFNGHSQNTGQMVGFTFARYEIGKSDFRNDLRLDYANLNLGGDQNYWRTNPSLIISASALVSRLTIPSTGAVNTDESEMFRQLIIGHDATHRRMLKELNKSLQELTTRRAELESLALSTEQTRKAVYEEAQAQLEEQKTALERQSHMATRRKIGQTIHKVMTDSSNASTLRYRGSAFASFVFLAYMCLGLAGGLGTYFTYLSLERAIDLGILTTTTITDNSADSVNDQRTIISPLSSATTWFLMLKFVISSVITVFGFVAAATWMRRHLDNETRLNEEKLAFVADVERASWVIEAIHEVKYETKGELPKEWVDAVTRNLFTPRASSAELDEGAQALRALIGLAGTAKIGPQGLEMEFNKKGTKALGES
jgi:hypothetical protein